MYARNVFLNPNPVFLAEVPLSLDPNSCPDIFSVPIAFTTLPIPKANTLYREIGFGLLGSR